MDGKVHRPLSPRGRIIKQPVKFNFTGCFFIFKLLFNNSKLYQLLSTLYPIQETQRASYHQLPIVPTHGRGISHTVRRFHTNRNVCLL